MRTKLSTITTHTAVKRRAAMMTSPSLFQRHTHLTPHSRHACGSGIGWTQYIVWTFVYRAGLPFRWCR